jgi:hypothetical protein
MTSIAPAVPCASVGGTLSDLVALLTRRRDDKTWSGVRAPFFTVWLCSWSPLPYWLVRILSPMAGYPVRKHLWATFLGRFPRLWFFAALGLYWGIDLRVVFALSGVAILGAVGMALKGGRAAGRSGGQGGMAVEAVGLQDERGMGRRWEGIPKFLAVTSEAVGE